MNLGLGLMAADEYFKEGDRRQVRDYNQRLRDAELSMLDDKTEATRSGYRDTRETNETRARLRPGQTANQEARIGLESADIEGQRQRQPAEIQTKNTQANIGLANAENDQANLPMTLQVKNDTLAGQSMAATDTLKRLPAKLAQLATQGVLDQRGQGEVVLGTMGQLIARQDKAGAIAFANEIAKVGNILPNTNGKTFTDIVPVRKGQNGAQGDGYIFVTSDGERKFTPVEAIRGAMSNLKSGKYKFIERDDGSIFAGDEGTGKGSIVQPGDPALARGKRTQSTPADIQSTEWLMANVPKYRGNPEAAWEAVRSSREKTRSSFIMEYVSKNAMPGSDTSKLSEDAGRIYDTLRQNQGPVQSNTRQSGTLGSGTYDPAISSLIGIP